MKVSYTALQSYFETPLPSAEVLADALTFHAWEIESVDQVGADTVLDVKILPDKSPWALSHRGIARDLSVILNLPMRHDAFQERPALTPVAGEVQIDIATPTCTRYTAAHIQGVTVGPSPKWLSDTLASLGQRSINNVVDVTNYVMFMLGQPLHAFDADKLSHAHGYRIGVRQAREGESIVVLTGESYTLSHRDAVIVDAGTDAPIGIAGIKGGKVAEVDGATTTIILESAHFDPVAIRKSSQSLRLRTDASTRFENGIVRDTAGYGVALAAHMLCDIASGTLVGFVDTDSTPTTREPMTLPYAKVNSVLGLVLSAQEIERIVSRFGYEATFGVDTVTITPPFWRSDLGIPEDFIEEIGRMYGYEHVPSVKIAPVPLVEMNTRFYYAEAIRQVLTGMGFSEIFTSSFRELDAIKMKNAFASDKGYLRSSLRVNMSEALQRNVGNRDLLGLSFIGLFEIGTVFTVEGERYLLSIGVRHAMEYKEKTDKTLLESACKAVQGVLGVDVIWSSEQGIAEMDLGEVLPSLASVTSYQAGSTTATIPTYVPFSPYPAMSRDIAFFVTGGVTPEAAAAVINREAGDLHVRTTLFDEFTKDGRTSYAFRLVFQSNERTLSDDIINPITERITNAVTAEGWQVR